MPVTLNDLPIGQSATVESVGATGALRQHFLDMGLIPQATVTMVKRAPMGDPIEVRIRSYELTLRVAEAEAITITDIREAEPVSHAPAETEEIMHPGLGEGGKFHEKKTEKSLPEGEVITFALAGNQNCGKTTLFNRLTGSNQHVGNFPGVTVDRKDGTIIGHDNTLVTDLPGIYSLSPYTNEEIVSREFILKENPKAIINIVDATNIERNLYLTMQLMELGKPMVLALNMMDEVWANGGSVRVNEMEALLGIPVIPISASRGEGIEELIDHALHVAKYQEAPTVQDFCDATDHGGAVHRCLHSIMHIIEDHAQKPISRFALLQAKSQRATPSSSISSTLMSTKCARSHTSRASLKPSADLTKPQPLPICVSRLSTKSAPARLSNPVSAASISEAFKSMKCSRGATPLFPLSSPLWQPFSGSPLM